MKGMLILVIIIGGLLFAWLYFAPVKTPNAKGAKAEETSPPVNSAQPNQAAPAETSSAEKKPAVCPTCNGTGKIPCPDPMCKMVRDANKTYYERRAEIRKQLIKERGAGFVTPEMVNAVSLAEGVMLMKRKTPCGKCGGTDNVTCPKCNGTGLAEGKPASTSPPANTARSK